MREISTLYKQHQKGQATLELALVLPIFLTLILGVFEIALLFFNSVSVANASREAARYAATSGCPSSTACLDADVQYYQDCTGIKNRAISKAPGISLTAANIVISYDHGPNNSGVISPIADACTASTPNLITGDRVVVTVTKQFILIVPIPGLKNFPIVSTTYRTYLGKIQ
jgi:Flp pilus assembly protein TadG